MRDKRLKVENTVDERPASKTVVGYAHSLGLVVQDGMTMSDVKAIVNRDLDDDDEASESFLTYARAKGMKCSSYIGNKALHNQLFDNLSLEDKAALFCFCVYKFHSEDKNENLLAHDKKQVFEDFGKHFAKDGYFTASLEDYLGEDCVAFGKSKRVVNGVLKNVYGGSIYGRAYKEAMAYIKESELLK